ncbi:MAG: alpha-galactosidase [Dysgonamonadaceae bacterium]|jgi:alpha-galactosidase|nr:alpha-galactosidase [Dysgonamonadaceae bacterium]
MKKIFIKTIAVFIAIVVLVIVRTNTLAGAEYIPITTANTCLLLKITDKNRPEQTYFGKNIRNIDELKKLDAETFAAYTTAGVNHVFEAALRAIQSDGNTSVELRYLSSSTEKKDNNLIHTVISLKDEHYDLFVNIHYNAYQQEDILEQWVEIKNEQKKSIRLTHFASSDLSFNVSDYYVSHFYGDWANEMNIDEQHLTRGIKIIDSKLGVRANQFTHPCFILSLNEPAAENTGEIIGGTLAWPGNFRFCFEVDNYNKLRILSGANPYASEYTLEKGETLKTPAFLFTYSDKGTGKMTRNFHRWALKYGIKNGDKERSILLNNWEATYFDFDEPKLTRIIDDAARMGFELFLLDDGWFGKKYPRNSDNAGLGDWQTNRDKLPNGIPYLINECKKRNLQFGIWVEPEMVNPKSELYEQHPDWVIAQPFRERTEQRNQLILDLSNPKVQEFVYNTVDRILTENPGIAYVKWDCNRYVFNSGSPYLPAGKQSHLFFDYPKHLLEIMEKVSRKYPDVTFMACSGGGGRIDYGSMKYFDEYWISDNNDPIQRIFTQWGAQYFFPAIGLASHVSVSPNHISGRSTPLKYRFDIAMAAKLGMDMQPSQMTEKEYEFSKNAIQTYKEIRNTILHGDLYRILSPYKHNRTVWMYVDETKDEAIVFNFLIRKEVYPVPPTIVLQGLDPEKQYVLQEINKAPDNWSRFSKYEGKIFSGEYLMTVGLHFAMYDEMESLTIKLKTKN